LKSQALTLFDLVERLSLLTRADLRQAGAAQGLQPVHLQVLFYLNQANRFSNTPQALTEYLGLTKGTVSQTILVLARRKLVSRHTDPRDGRVVRLILSEGGVTLLKTLSAGSAWRDIVKTASPARVASALLVLRQILAQVQTQSGKRSFGVCATCRHNQRVGPRSYFCGLMQEKLSSPEARRICREHAPPQALGPVLSA
jgi:DNA-binding MarR family transcriptional regulator